MRRRLVSTLLASVLSWTCIGFAASQLPDQALNNPVKDRPYVSVDSFREAYEAARQRRAAPVPTPASAVATDSHKSAGGFLGGLSDTLKGKFSQKLDGLGQKVNDAMTGATKPDVRPAADAFPFTDNDASAAVEMVPKRAAIVTITGNDGHTINIVAPTAPGATSFAAAMATPIPKSEGQFVSASNAPTDVVTQGPRAVSSGQEDPQADQMWKVYRCDAQNKCGYVMERSGGPASH